MNQLNDGNQQEPPNLMRTLQMASSEAAQLERARWELVKGRYPGQPGHDPKAWAEWLRAASALREAAARLRSITLPR
jgi:hypothetical protein